MSTNSKKKKLSDNKSRHARRKISSLINLLRNIVLYVNIRFMNNADRSYIRQFLFVLHRLYDIGCDDLTVLHIRFDDIQLSNLRKYHQSYTFNQYIRPTPLQGSVHRGNINGNIAGLDCQQDIPAANATPVIIIIIG